MMEFVHDIFVVFLIIVLCYFAFKGIDNAPVRWYTKFLVKGSPREAKKIWWWWYVVVPLIVVSKFPSLWWLVLLLLAIDMVRICIDNGKQKKGME